MTSCTPFKQTSSSSLVMEGNRVEYTMYMEKDAKDYLEIVDVILLNSETDQSESVTFQVVDTDGKTTLLNLKGYASFIIVSSTMNADLNPDRAIVMYKNDPEGKMKSEVIKPLIAQTEE